MNYTENALNILTVRTYPNKGPAWIGKNLQGNETIDELCQMLLTDEEEFLSRRCDIEAEINKLQDHIDGFVALGDAAFASPRGNVKSADKPYALFYRGDLSLLQQSNLNIAVIGVLNPDEKIELTERMVTQEIIRYGATIVSGLALGCDTIAHKTAIEHSAKTIAILPSPLNSMLPKENIRLAEQIVEQGGLLISEYFGKPKSKYDLVSRFVNRDRLQAMYSDAVLLSASYAQNNQGNDCGSRHALEKAKLYGIKRGVIYNDMKHIDNPMYDLNRQLLREDPFVIRIDSSNMSESVRQLVSR